MNKALHAYWWMTVALVALASLGDKIVYSETISAEDQAFFETKIRPVLVEHCYECHSADSKEVGGKLLLDSRAEMLKGGESGPSLIAGKPEESLIIQALRFEDVEMPPEKPLPEAVVNHFIEWVKRGAPDPRTKVLSEFEKKEFTPESLWSFASRKNPAPPKVNHKAWVRDPLDAFVLKQIEAAELHPTTDANARTLIRRLYNDLIGLPPTIQQVETFVAEHQLDSLKATERLVDNLLSRPEFGERWARHWLDVARYGESNGDDGLGRNATFPHAWRYRDYVIDAINRDVPYDRFITEQIAGDLLPATSAEQRNRQLVATGFLAIGAKPAAAMNKNFAMDIVDDQINAVSTAILGLSVACARCHDHKHDPIPTRDYYAMAGIFTNSETLYGAAANEKLTAPPTKLHNLKSKWNPDDLVKKKEKAVLEFPETYSAVVENLQPLVHSSLKTKPAGLTVDSKVQFTPKNFAAVKTATIHHKFETLSDSYSVSFWFKNETLNNKRPITAYLFSRAELGNKKLPGDHLGIGGTHDKPRTGKLFVFNGNDAKESIPGTTVIAKGTWNHIVLVRNKNHIKVFLNGADPPEIDTKISATFGDSLDYCFANRSDNFAPLVGNLAELAVFSRALTDDEAHTLHSASGQPEAARSLGLAMGVRDKAKIENCKIHIKGETAKLGPSVPRGILTAYNRDIFGNEDQRFPSLLDIPENQSGRLQLAAWLTHPDHPQTARVAVNRVWLHLFGRGLVTTPDDFGVYGARPTHPELLDHLAERFVKDGWSLKRFIRAVVLSRTYQLDSRCDEKLVNVDPDNKFFARHSRRRLDAESIRDGMLHVSGQLELGPEKGSAIDKIDSLINWPPGEATNLHRETNHRSIYLCMLRHAPPPELSAFDFPDGIGIAGQRNDSVLPTQTLFLLNNPFVVAQADALATLVLAEQNWDDSQRIQEIFRRVLLRNPDKNEKQQAAEYIESMKESLPQNDDNEAQLRKPWATFSQALLTTNEFRYVD